VARFREVGKADAAKQGGLNYGDIASLIASARLLEVLCIRGPLHKRPFVGVFQVTVLGFGDGFGAILRGTVAKR